MSMNVPQYYHQDWRHFDSLVWQVPSWSTAIFTLTVATSGFLLVNGAVIEKAFQINILLVLAVFLTAISAIFCLLIHVLNRFRLHRGGLSPIRPILGMPTTNLFTDTALSLILFIELAFLVAASVIVWNSVIAWCFDRLVSVMVAVLVVLVWFLVSEFRLAGNIREMRSAATTKSNTVNNCVAADG